MRRSWLVGGAVLTLAATALLLLPNVSLAQRRFGRDWGGGYGSGGYDGYYGNGYGYDGFGRGYGWGAPGYGGGYYGYNRGWYSPGVYNYDSGPSYGYDTGEYYPPQQGQPQQGQTYYGGDYAMDQGNMPAQNMASLDQNKAHIVLRVPSNAQVTFDGQSTTSQGPLRAYVSPPIDPNKDYTYNVKAQWTQDGRQVTQDRQVRVRAGQIARVNFMQQQGGRPTYGAEPGTENEQLVPPADRTGIDQNRNDQNRNDQNRNDLNRSPNNPPSPAGNQNTPKTTPPGSPNQNPSNP
jgi:uncharacterized protein (TIGR03000 family)